MTNAITLIPCANGIIAMRSDAPAGDLSGAYVFSNTASMYGGDGQKLLDFIKSATAPDPTPAEVKAELVAASAELTPETPAA